MLRIGICDDTAAARENLRLLCLKHFRLEEPEFFEFSTGDGAVRLLKGHPGALDLLFLDIEMPCRSGMEAAETIRAFDREVLLAFVTSYTDYVSRETTMESYYTDTPLEQETWYVIDDTAKTSTSLGSIFDTSIILPASSLSPISQDIIFLITVKMLAKK